MNKIKYLLIVVILSGCEPKDNSPLETYATNSWASNIYEFKPAPGQFQNKGDNSLSEQAENILGDNSDFVSLGMFGGYIIFDFGGTIENYDGPDIAIYGNSFLNSSEPAIVQISYDNNADGLPNDTWYELKGSEYDKSETLKNYEITYFKPQRDEDTHIISWSNANGNSGVFDFANVKSFHSQEIYPESYSDSITFKGTLLNNNIVYENEPFLGMVYKWLAYDWGYADNKGYEQDGQLKGADLFDFDNAVDATGNTVVIEKVSFIKVYSATLPTEQFGLTFIGDRSPEISKSKYLHLSE